MFELGTILSTPGALKAIEDSGQTPAEFVSRHANCDWGDVCEEDAVLNDKSLQDGARLLSAYHTEAGEKIWVITEADRSSTTILRPDEY